MDGNAVAVAPNVVNGINVDDLFALIEGVKRDPAKGKTEWHVATTWQGQTHSRAEVEGFGMGGNEVPRRFSIDIDEPCELGGLSGLPVARARTPRVCVPPTCQRLPLAAVPGV